MLKKLVTALLRLRPESFYDPQARSALPVLHFLTDAPLVLDLSLHLPTPPAEALAQEIDPALITGAPEW